MHQKPTMIRTALFLVLLGGLLFNGIGVIRPLRPLKITFEHLESYHTAYAATGPIKSGVKNGVREVGHAVKRGAKETGHAIKGGVKSVGHSIKKSGKTVGHSVKRGAKSVGHFFRHIFK